MAQKGKPAASRGEATNDPRFASMTSDPKFRLPSKKQNRVTLDPRFSRLFKDDTAAKKSKVDRYGRPLAGEKGDKWVEKMYQLEGEDEEEEEVDDDEEVRLELKRFSGGEGRKYDPAREGGFESSSEEESEEEGDEEGVDVMSEEDEADAELPDGQGEVPTGEVSRRLAVVNLDWDNIRAADIMAVAASFLSGKGRVESVTVYPSEFGREMMDKEELEGPPSEIFAKAIKAGEQDDDEDRVGNAELNDTGEEFDDKALRAYQLQRLRYYYAVIECSSKDSAKLLYDNLDGREYLSSANFFDLRFVPDETSFEDDKPRESCTSLPDGYKPIEFKTSALTHSKVQLTWDEDDHERKEAQRRAFSQKDEVDDLAAYVASESESEVEVGADEGSRQSKAAALRAALGLSAGAKSSKKKDARPVGDLQVTFSSGLTAGSKKESVFENEPVVEESTIEKYKRKEKERKAKRKEKAKNARIGITEPTAMESTAGDVENVDEDAGFNDPFFEDPDGPAAQKAAKAARKAEKERKRSEKAAKEKAAAAERAELELLIDSKDGADFDMAAIVKAEKNAKKRGKKARDAAKELEQDEFKMDVKDPRFAKLYEDHEFAIDPTHPRFQRTKAMDALLDEGRKRKKGRGDDGEEPVREKKAKKADRGEDLRTLAEKVKRKSRV